MSKELLNPRLNKSIIEYVVLVIFFTIVIGIFSLIMSGISGYRNDVYLTNLGATEKIYNGPIKQSAPSIGAISEDSVLYSNRNLTRELVDRYVKNTSLVSTDADVRIEADFVKKGLAYQPTYKTQFKATYILKNDLEEQSAVVFNFPFPVDTTSQEISNAKLIVNGEEIPDAKSEIDTDISEVPMDYYPIPRMKMQGLSWEGDIPAKGEANVEVYYDTVGLSMFSYQGIENPKGSQDFNFSTTIVGTRSYDVQQGLSVTSREFGDNSVKLVWEKPDLYSNPLIQVAVGDKVNPSTQVSRVYLTMAPIYMTFMTILLYLAYRFGKQKFSIFDVFLVTALFVVYFPFVHYLSSFTIDPTIELFSSFANVPTYSMSVYVAFLLTGFVIGGLMYYLIGKVSGFKFSNKFAIPAIVLFLGFFPLVVTIPEYSMLLVLIGVIALVAIIVQARVRTVKIES